MTSADEGGQAEEDQQLDPGAGGRLEGFLQTIAGEERQGHRLRSRRRVRMPRLGGRRRPPRISRPILSMGVSLLSAFRAATSRKWIPGGQGERRNRRRAPNYLPLQRYPFVGCEQNDKIRSWKSGGTRNRKRRNPNPSVNNDFRVGFIRTSLIFLLRVFCFGKGGGVRPSASLQSG